MHRFSGDKHKGLRYDRSTAMPAHSVIRLSHRGTGTGIWFSITHFVHVIDNMRWYSPRSARKAPGLLQFVLLH
jgi:hypothetical protein